MSKLKFAFHVLIAIIILPVFVYADLTSFFRTEETPAPVQTMQKVENTTSATPNGYIENAINKCSPSSYPHFINY